jgi:hypothetical protein
MGLLILLNNGIKECFEGLKFDFTSHGEEHPNKILYLLLSIDLYETVIGLVCCDEDCYNKSISELEYDLPAFVEIDDYILWGEDRILLRVSKKDHALLEASRAKFAIFLKNLPNSEITAKAKDIIAEVDKLKHNREYILRKLKEAMLYSSFPGKCQYLQ